MQVVLQEVFLAFCAFSLLCSLFTLGPCSSQKLSILGFSSGSDTVGFTPDSVGFMLNSVGFMPDSDSVGFKKPQNYA